MRNCFSKKKNCIYIYIYNLGLKQNIIVTLDDYLLSWWLRNCFGKKRKLYKYNLELKKLLVTLDDYLLSCGGGGSGRGSGCGDCDCCLL